MKRWHWHLIYITLQNITEICQVLLFLSWISVAPKDLVRKYISIKIHAESKREGGRERECGREVQIVLLFVVLVLNVFIINLLLLSINLFAAHEGGIKHSLTWKIPFYIDVSYR